MKKFWIPALMAAGCAAVISLSACGGNSLEDQLNAAMNDADKYASQLQNEFSQYENEISSAAAEYSSYASSAGNASGSGALFPGSSTETSSASSSASSYTSSAASSYTSSAGSSASSAVSSTASEISGPPVFTSVSASSTLAPQGKYNYVADNLFKDNDLCWCEGVSGDGVGQSVYFSANSKQALSGLQIRNGYVQTDSTFRENSRVSEIQITFDDGSSVTRSLTDTQGLQTVTFPKVETTSFTITIKGVYKGTTYSDTCITYVRAI